MFDYTDHNLTLDGKETVHCLGGIPIYTPEYTVSFESGSKKLPIMSSAFELTSQQGIETIPYGNFNWNAMKSIASVATRQLRLGKLPLVPQSYVAYVCQINRYS